MNWAGSITQSVEAEFERMTKRLLDLKPGEAIVALKRIEKFIDGAGI